ncbi:thiazole tautomerase TenI [Neobacillus drentensis]|uniref:thiazole tautomerase TenI n=1 Tax=Neobacillus drentensis TaxID=220684 RepID=UPI00286C6232|nr:thiazole tautomerase TenI [Neobacillus drentensis]
MLFTYSLFKKKELHKGGTCILSSIKELHIISNGTMPMEQFRDIAMDIHPYVNAIHLREKQKTARELFQAIDLLINANIPLSKIIINDRVDVALVTRARGVQLAFHSLDAALVKESFPELRVGSSIHSYQEGQKAKENGADYLLFGHVFPSKSKPGKTPQGLEELTRLTQLDIPVIAIGGITAENTRQILHAGANGIAVMSGVLEAPDPILAVKDYRNILKEGGGYGGKFI